MAGASIFCGILMASFVDRDAERVRRRWDRACEHLHVLLAEVLPAGSDTQRNPGDQVLQT
jgi:hypothetical protein